jgi:hypothetical protein
MNIYQERMRRRKANLGQLGSVGRVLNDSQLDVLAELLPEFNVLLACVSLGNLLSGGFLLSLFLALITLALLPL